MTELSRLFIKLEVVLVISKKEVAAAILKIVNTTSNLIKSLDSSVTHLSIFCSKIRCKGVEKVQKCVANMNFSFFFTFLYNPALITLLWLHAVKATIRDLTGCSVENLKSY